MLRITKEGYRGELLKDKKLLLGRNDGRYAAPITEAGVGPDPSNAFMPAFTRLFDEYLREYLKVDRTGEYVLASTSAGLEGWKWGATTPFSDWPYVERLQEAFDANPRFHVLIGNGYHDTQTTAGAALYAILQSGWPMDRAATTFYEGGHMAYTVEESARKFGDDIRNFVQHAQ